MIIASSLLFLSQPLAADVLTDLRASLSRMQARSDVRARVEISATSEMKDDDDAQKEQGTVTVDVAKTANGLTVSFPETLIARAVQEAQQKSQNPELGSPTRSGLSSVDAVSINESLDYAVLLQRRLTRAKVIEQKNGLLDGKPSRVVTLAITPALSKSERKRVKKLDVSLKLWLDDEGFPVVIEESSVMKLSFMLLSFENKETEKVTLARHDDRLIALRREEISSGSGVGQSFKSRRVTTLTLR
jgi:hypothetical protein